MAGLVRSAVLIGLIAWHSPTHAPQDVPPDAPTQSLAETAARTASAGRKALAALDPEGEGAARLAAEVVTQFSPQARAELARLALIAARGAIAGGEGSRAAASP